MRKEKRTVISMSVLATVQYLESVRLHNLHITEHNFIFLRIRESAFSTPKSLIKHDKYTSRVTNREMISS
jgi:hypothetical protein